MPRFRVTSTIELEAIDKGNATQDIVNFLDEERDVSWKVEVLETEEVKDDEQED